MATVKIIREDVFLISWPAKNPNYYGQPAETTIQIPEIYQSCRLCYKKDTVKHKKTILEIEIDQLLPLNGSKKYKILKPASVLAINSGIEKTMEFTNDEKWTTTFTESCTYGQRANDHSVNLHILIELNSASMKAETKHVMDHLSNLWETKKLADVTFKFQEKELKAHTLIVTSGSPALAAMFQHDFKENKERVVKIKDTKATVFEKMLQFFYTGDAGLDDDELDTTDLLILANKYGVDSLKEKCALYMTENLTVDNVIGYLVVAHLHQSLSLYKSALKFISQNSKAIVLRKDWLNLMKNYHEISSAAVKMMVLTPTELESSKTNDEAEEEGVQENPVELWDYDSDY